MAVDVVLGHRVPATTVYECRRVGSVFGSGSIGHPAGLVGILVFSSPVVASLGYT